jgi:phytoene synthase
MHDDLAGPVIRTEGDLDVYCYRVAGAVGELMTAILGVTRDDAWGAARALGLAMQRTNVLRDVDEDLAAGRVYLAADTLRAFGIDDLRTADREALYRDQIARADALYDEGLAGVDALVHGGRAIAAAGRMYREILRQIEREGYGATRTRAVVPRSRKLRLVAGALVRPT